MAIVALFLGLTSPGIARADYPVSLMYDTKCDARQSPLVQGWRNQYGVRYIGIVSRSFVLGDNYRLVPPNARPFQSVRTRIQGDTAALRLRSYCKVSGSQCCYRRVLFTDADLRLPKRIKRIRVLQDGKLVGSSSFDAAAPQDFFTANP